MSEQLKPGAFRVFDNEKGFYDEGDGRSQWFLYGDGRLFLNYIYGADEEDPLMQMDEVSPTRYQVERWTGLYDRDSKPVYEGDILQNVFINYLQGRVEFDRGRGCHLAAIYIDDRFSNALTPDSFNKCRIIGTIHDSPEALEAKAREVDGD